MVNTISYSLNKGSLNDAKKKIRLTRPLIKLKPKNGGVTKNKNLQNE